MLKKASPLETSQTEYHNLYDPPRFNDNDRGYFFNLSDVELSALKQFRITQNKAHFVLLLGYFKAKPVTLTLTYGMVKNDLHHIYARYFPKARLVRKNLDKCIKGSCILYNIKPFFYLTHQFTPTFINDFFLDFCYWITNATGML